MRWLSALLLAAVAGCRAPAPAEAEPIDLTEWGYEEIALPPEFAPGLPAGLERLLFAPGMFEEGAEDFWSYAFAMRIEREGLDAEGLTELLEAYFEGLIRAVAGDRGARLGADPAAVQIEREGPGRFRGRVALIDAFVTMRAVGLTVKIEATAGGAGDTVLRVIASPQSTDHWIWRDLEAALATIEI